MYINRFWDSFWCIQKRQRPSVTNITTDGAFEFSVPVKKYIQTNLAAICDMIGYRIKHWDSINDLLTGCLVWIYAQVIFFVLMILKMRWYLLQPTLEFPKWPFNSTGIFQITVGSAGITILIGWRSLNQRREECGGLLKCQSWVLLTLTCQLLFQKLSWFENEV